MSDDVTITVRVNDLTAAGFRDVNGRLRDMNVRFATAAGDMNRSSSMVGRALGDIKASMLSLAPAAIPVAASMAPIAVQAGAAAVAVGAFGAALAPQISSLGDAAKAQDSYNEAVRKYGRGSTQAAQAQLAASQTLASMPAATQRAAVGWQSLREQASAWSDSLAKFTMAPVEKSFAVMGQVLPKLTPMVKGTATELGRLMDVAGGGVSTGAFDALSERVSSFANQTLKGATDKAIHFMRVLSEGNASGPMMSFFEYARAQGPAVKELLSNVGQAVSNLMEGAAQAGPGLLSIVNALAKMVAAVPPSLVGNLMQVYAAFKLIKLAGAGIVAVGDGIRALAARITTVATASAGAAGGAARLRAGFTALGATAKASIVVGGLALLAIGIKKLADGARGAPPDVDKLTSSLKALASTGKFTGELKKTFGDVDGLVGKIKLLGQETAKSKETAFGFRIPGLDDLADKIAGSINDMSKGDKSLNALQEDFGALDKSMASLVSNGYADQAAEDFDIVKKAALAQGYSLKEVSKLFPQYKSVVADAKWEQDQTAESMSIFGQAAQDTSVKLEAQKGAADGLRASILALNDVNRSAYDAQIGYEASLDSLTEAFKQNGATLDVHTEKGRANGQAMSQAAKSQDEFISAGVAAGDSLASMTKKSSELRETMMRLATDAFDGNKQKAREYVNTLLGTPSDIKTLVRLEREEAISGLKSVRDAIEATPGAKKVKVDTLSGAAIAALEAVGLKTKQLPNGKTAVYTTNGQSLGSIGAVSIAMNNLDGKTATTYVTTVYAKAYRDSRQGERDYTNRKATGGILKFYADGGTEQHVAEIAPAGTMRIWAEPETGGESYIPLSPAKRGRSRQIAEKTVGILGGDVQWFAKGGLTKAERQARKDAAGDLSVSHYGRMAGYSRSEFGAALGKPDSIGALVSALGQWRGVIMKATHGGTESRLLKQLDSTAKGLLKYEKQLNSVTKHLEKARDKLSSLKDAASSLSSSVRGGVLSSSNITRGASGGGLVTVASVMGGLTASKDKATAFASALKRLKQKGFSASVIRQIAEAGIDGGGLETAGALLEASSSEVKSMNDAQKDINKAAKEAGKTAADSVYGKAIKEQTKTVKHLEKTQEKLRHSMEKLAKAMEKAIEKAFNGKAAGGIVGAAASGGIRGGLTWVGEHEPELLQLPVGSRVWSGPDSRRKARELAAPWASMLNTPRRGPSSGAAPATAVPMAGLGAGQPIVIQLAIGKQQFGELWVDVGRNEVRARGSIEATLKPPRGR